MDGEWKDGKSNGYGVYTEGGGQAKYTRVNGKTIGSMGVVLPLLLMMVESSLKEYMSMAP